MILGEILVPKKSEVKNIIWEGIMKEELVSIITPVYNGEEFIEETILNILQQTYKEWEWLIVDDCSTDLTKNIIKKYSKKDLRIKYISLKKNSGAGVARNEAIKNAKGEYISFLDSDDYWGKEKLEKQIRFMNKNNVSFSYTNHRKVDEEKKEIKVFLNPSKLTYKKILRYNPLHTSSVVYNCEKLGKIYMPEIRKRQDYGLWLRILKKCEGFCCEEVLTNYVQREGSLSQNKVNLIKYNWELYREVEGLSLIKSLYCLGWDIFSKLSKIK